MNNIKKLLCLFVLIFLPFSVFAEEKLKFDGDYSLDYLLKNYNVITFNQLENPQNKFIDNFYLTNINTSIEGPVLINGDYLGDKLDDVDLNYSELNPNEVVSHISGNKSDNVISSSITSFDGNFIDYNKLYKSVLAESTALSNITEYNIS